MWPLAILAYTLFYNFSESAILGQNNVLWILYVATLLSMAARVGEVAPASATERAITPELVGIRPTSAK